MLNYFLLGTFCSTQPSCGSCSVCCAPAGLLWSPCTWANPTAGCSLWISATFGPRNGAWRSSYDATQHAEADASWPEDWCSPWSNVAPNVSAAAPGSIFVCSRHPFISLYQCVLFNPHNLSWHPASNHVWDFTLLLVLILLASRAQMMIHPNANQGVRYMPNARNGAYPAMLPQGQGFPSAMPSPQQDGSSLTGALASASPADQQQVTI